MFDAVDDRISEDGGELAGDQGLIRQGRRKNTLPSARAVLDSQGYRSSSIGFDHHIPERVALNR